MTTTSSYKSNNNANEIIKVLEPLHKSFSKIDEQNGVSIYYTCPSNTSENYNSDEIIHHYKNTLSQLGDSPWIWILDSKEFGLKQSLETQTAIGVAKLISPQKYGKNLQQIVIANPTIYIKTALSIVTPFLSADIRNKITYHKK